VRTACPPLIADVVHEVRSQRAESLALVELMRSPSARELDGEKTHGTGGNFEADFSARHAESLKSGQRTGGDGGSQTRAAEGDRRKPPAATARQVGGVVNGKLDVTLHEIAVQQALHQLC
jgi:hypothetical protein